MVVVAGVRGVADIVAPVFLALMLTITVSPLTQWLRRHGTPVWLAITATIVASYLILIGLGGALIVSAAQLIDLLPEYAARFATLREDMVEGLSGLGVSTEQIRDAVAGVNPTALAGLVGTVAGSLAGVLSNGVFLLAVLFFLCVDAVHFPARLHSAIAERPQVVSALRTFAHGTRRYLLVSTVFGLIVAIIDTLMLWALGVPLPVLWGLLAFITNYVPNVGFVIGLVPPALLGLLEGGADLMVTVILLYCAVNFVIQSLIQPKVVGDAVGLSATVSFLSLVVWAWMLGPLGALLAIPLSLLAKGLLIDIDPSASWLNRLLAGGRPAEPLAPTESPPPRGSAR
ncbi:AI-2E family transporter [Cryptosporangium minutisporangium]|uniref:AI-2E family transporter n=1 Tax=Cryptosporangium minutisporangium TaxID=113569 RepID=A0ABP6SRE1_9ACTN